MVCKTSRSMPNFLWRQVISLFLDTFYFWYFVRGAHRISTKLYPNLFFQGNGSRVGGWVGDLAPNLDEFFGFPETWPHPIGPSDLHRTFRQVIQMVQKARVAQVQWQLDKLGGFEIWNLLGRLVGKKRGLETTENLLGKVPDRHGPNLSIFDGMKTRNGMTHFSFVGNSLGVGCLCQLKYLSINMEDVPGSSATKCS